MNEHLAEIDYEKEAADLLVAHTTTEFIGKLKSFVQRIHSSVPEMTDFSEAKELLIQKALRGLPKQVGNYPVEIKIRVLADEIVRLRLPSSVPDTKGLEKRFEELIEAAKCIHHWHDWGKNNDGMVVSAEHVMKLWEETKLAESALTSYRERK